MCATAANSRAYSRLPVPQAAAGSRKAGGKPRAAGRERPARSRLIRGWKGASAAVDARGRRRLPLDVPHANRLFRHVGVMMLLVMTPSVLAISVATADHPADEVHLDAAHGPHDAPAPSADQRTESRAVAFAALPAPRPIAALDLVERRGPGRLADAAAPEHRPPKPAPARSPPPSV